MRGCKHVAVLGQRTSTISIFSIALALCVTYSLFELVSLSHYSLHRNYMEAEKTSYSSPSKAMTTSPRRKCKKSMINLQKHIKTRNKRWRLGCVNSTPAAGGSQEAGFTQPSLRLLFYVCSFFNYWFGTFTYCSSTHVPVNCTGVQLQLLPVCLPPPERVWIR